MNAYHIHVTSPTKPKGRWKKTEIFLEKGARKENHEMYTKTVLYDGFVEEAIYDIIEDYKKDFESISRFKIELLNQPDYFRQYTPEHYREVHIKTKIPKENFEFAKQMLKEDEDYLGFALSSNPKEVKDSYVTQFLNMRFLSGDFDESNIKIERVKDLLKQNNLEIIEVKDELSVYDTNFKLDKWWAH